MIRLRTVIGNSNDGSTAARARYVLRTSPAREHRLICAAHLTPRREQQHARRQPVQPMSGRQLREIQFPPQPYRRRLRHMPATRHRRQEVRFVDHHDVVVAIQHRNVERHRHFIGQIPVQVDMRIGWQHRGRGHHSSVGGDDFAGKHFRRGGLAEPVRQLNQHRTAAQPYPRGAEPVARRQRAARLN